MFKVKKLFQKLAKDYYWRANNFGKKLVRAEESTPKSVKLIGLVTIFVATAIGLAWYLKGKNVAVFQPTGTIGEQQLRIIYIALILSAIVVIPVFIMAISFYVNFREDNKKSTYKPNWDHSKSIETVWWALPIVLIGVLSVITWNSSHQLDPFKSIASAESTLKIQVVSLDWKWLFIYPEQKVATVNYAYIPVNTPVDFQITSDAPMNSFWIPQLGSQVYAMSGMVTHLNSEATSEGVFTGSAANITGEGFAGMNFKINVVGSSAFSDWVESAKSSPFALDWDSYQKLAMPSKNVPDTTMTLADGSVFDLAVMKYMNPGLQLESFNSTSGGTY